MTRDDAETVRVAYMATGYPYPSHTFIQNEVRALRALGADVVTFAHRRATPDEVLSDADRQEFARTFAVRPLRAVPYMRAALAALLRNPSGLARAARTAVRLRGDGPRSLLWQLFYLGQAIVLWHRCRLAGLRHIHAHFANVGSDVTMLAAELGGEGWSWSFTMHGPTELYDVTWFRLGRKVEHARFVVCISDFARSQLMGLVDSAHWPKLRVIHCGVDTAALARRADGRRAAEARPCVVCVARLVSVKGQLVLLEALARLKGRGREAEVVLIGDGPMRQELADAARRLGLEDRVRILGSLSHPEALEHIGRSDVFCLPSFAEGVPIVLMEAMALGVPVVATTVMGVPELVRDGVSGRLVAPGNRDALASALGELIDDDDLRADLGRAAREQVAAEYDIWDSARALHALFREMLLGAVPDAALTEARSLPPSRRAGAAP